MSKFSKMESEEISITQKQPTQNPFDIFDFHLIVAGASLEGLACAKEAAKIGAKVCVISDGETFYDLQTTLFLEFLHKSINCGYEAQKLATVYSWRACMCCDYKFNWKMMMDRIKVAVRCSLKEKLDYYMDSKVSYVEGNLKFLDDHKISFEATLKRIYWADNYLIAPSGTKITDKRFPDIKGADLYGITILDLMNTSEMFGEILIVGDGSAAVQLASLLATLFEVTLFCRKSPVPDYDKEMVGMYIEAAGFTIWEKSILTMITETKCGRFEVHYTRIDKNWRGISFFDKVIFIPHEKVNLKKFKLENTGIKETRYEIPTTENFQSSVKHIYAMGKVAKNPHDICHMPYQNGRHLARFIFSKKKCVNTIFEQTGVLLGRPSYCFVGLSEEEAIKRLGADNIDVYISYFHAQEILSIAPGIPLNYLKIICIRDEKQKILGMHFFGPYAPTVMQGYATALRCGKLTVNDVRNNIGIFPTVAGEFTQVWVTKRSELPLNVSICCG